MPFSVKCQCGKVFNVKDEMQGRMVRCQVCGTEFMVLADVPVQQPGPPSRRPPEAASLRLPRLWPPAFVRIARSGFRIRRVLPLLQGSLARLWTREKERGSSPKPSPLWTSTCRIPRTWRLTRPCGADSLRQDYRAGALALLGLIMFVGGIAVGDTEGGIALIVFGVIFGIIFGISLLVSLCNDFCRCAHRNGNTTSDACRRFFKACGNARWKKAFVALAPAGRNCAVVHQPALEKVVNEPETSFITDLQSFRNYCAVFFAARVRM